jgi:hypothetical protein
LISRTLAENPKLAESVTVLFPEDVCNPSSWNVFGTYGVHLMEGTWRPNTSYVRRRVAQRWEAWAMGRLLRQSRRLGKARRLATASAPSNT